MTDLARWWPLPDRTDLRDRLCEAYDDAARGYHDRTHLVEVLERLAELMPPDHPTRDAVLLAAWFHDAVYDTDGDNEERSARLAEEELADTPHAAEVARLVRLTETHRPTDDDLDGQLLCDADLAILAAPRERYDAYVAGVRRDYAHISDEDFTIGRAAVLRDLGARDRLFHTAYAREHWEPAARANLAAELAALG